MSTQFEYDPTERVKTIAARLFRTRPRAEVVLFPYVKNITQHVDPSYYAALEQVDLQKVFPTAEEGQACFVSFYVSSATEDDGYIRISNDVDVYLDGQKKYSCCSSETEYVLVPVHVSGHRIKVDIKCYCRKDRFSFEYQLTSRVYPEMWALDYLLHIRRTLPLEEYRNEEGIAISSLYPSAAGPEAGIEYVFPKPTADSYKKDFYAVYPDSVGNIGFAYAEVKKAGALTIKNASPIKVYVNGEAVSEKKDSGEFTLAVEADDRLLVKSVRSTNAWGFCCEDTLLRVPVIHSDRKQGDKWLLIGAFGKEPTMSLAYGPEYDLSFEKLYRNASGEKVFWRLADGSYIRPYWDSFFFGQWFYALMLGHWGILKAARATNEPQWQKYYTDSISILGKWFEYMKYDYEQLGVVTPFLQRSLVLDRMDPIGTMGMNLADLVFLTGDLQAKDTLHELKDALYRQVPRMENGIINRIETMWSDDLFMAVPFLVRLGIVFGEEQYAQDAFTQLNEYYNKMFIEKDQVFSHIFFVQDYEKSNVPWGRGNGWAMVAMSEYLDHTPADDKNRKAVIEIYRKFVEGVCALQAESGMWHQVLNQPDTYEETSCTAMFLYSMLRGVKLGILSKEKVSPVIHKAYQGLCNKAIDVHGNIQGVCKGSECSRDWRYYAKLGTVKNDDHGTGIILAAISEYIGF